MPTDLPPPHVAEDMARIFRPLEGRAATTDPAADPGAPAVPSRRRRRAPLVAGVAVVVAIAAAAMGFTLGRDASITTRTAAGPATAVRPHRVAAPPEAVPSPTAATAARPAAAPPHPAPTTTVAVRPRARAAVAEAPLRARREEARAPSDCPPGSEEDACIYRDVLAADARLRRAYDRAARAGVATSRLEAIHRRWDRARDGADDDPDGTIFRYDRLADRLDDARRDATR